MSSKNGRHTDNPVDPDWLALQVVEAMPENGILVDEGLTSLRYIPSLRAHRDRYGYHARAPGASDGDCRRPSAPAPCRVLRGPRQRDVLNSIALVRRASPASAHGGADKSLRWDGFKDPPVNYTAIAKELGLESIRVENPGELPSVLSSAFNRPGAKLIEVMVNGTLGS